jgi:uncharacterized membrane protein YfcA
MLTLLLLAAAGFAAGFVDAIAGGGGLVTLPALLFVGLPPHLALGTNKGQAVFGAVASARAYTRRGQVDKDRAPLAFACGLVGSLVGAAALLAVRPEPLKPIVMGLLLVAATILAVRRDLQPQEKKLARPRLALAAIALVLGAYDGFFGPGVGSLLIIAFVVVFGDGVLRASGNAKIVNLASNLAAVTLFTFRGVVVWKYSLAMAAANVAGAMTGAHFAMRGGDKFVRAVVLGVVAVVIVKLGYDLI